MSILIEGYNSQENLVAVLECNDKASYLYIYPVKNELQEIIDPVAVWVCNFIEAPTSYDINDMANGAAPANPCEFCIDITPSSPLDKQSLYLVWLPEGNGVALYDDRELPLAIIPPWGGASGFNGYSRNAKGQGRYAWELDEKNVLINRFTAAKKYWRKIDEDDYFQNLILLKINSLDKIFSVGARSKNIDSNSWPTIVNYQFDNKNIFITAGVSLRPQPNVEMYVENYSKYKFIEIGVIINNNWTTEQIASLKKFIIDLSYYPWDYFKWFGPRHTFPCNIWKNKKFNYVMFSYSHSMVEELEMLDENTKILWLLPITELERQEAIDNNEPIILEKDRWLFA